MLFRHEDFGRVVQNLGGIGNLTAIPKGASAGKMSWPSILGRGTW